MKNIKFVFILLLTFSVLQAQNVGIGTSSPKDYTKLDIQSTTSGFQLPRMTTVQRATLAANISGLSVLLSEEYSGMLVYDTDVKIIYMWDQSKSINGAWKDVLDSDATVDDADADPTNEYNTSLSLSGTTLTITDGGGNKTQDLTSLKDHNWYKQSTTEPATSINDNIYTQGDVGIGTTNSTHKLQVKGGHIGMDGNRSIVIGGDNTDVPDTSPDAQLVLDGLDNGVSSLRTKLLIRGLDNETEVKAIDVEDENGNNLFYVKTTTGNHNGEAFFKGFIKAPNWPAFNVYNTGGSNQSTSGVFDATVELFDNGNNFNLTTNKFTAPVSGFYQFNWTSYTNSSAGRVFLLVNGLSVIQTNSNDKSIAVTLSLNANDEVWLSGNGFTMSWYGATTHNAFSGHLIMGK